MHAPVDELELVPAAGESAGEPLPRRPHSHVEPVRLRTYDPVLRVDKLTGVGHRFRCTCGAAGPWRHDRAEAAGDKTEHDRRHELGELPPAAEPPARETP